MSFHFANPYWSRWLWCLLGLFAVIIWLHCRRPKASSSLVSSSMGQRLAYRPALGSTMLQSICWLLCCVAILLAAMRPRVDGGTHLVPQVGAQIMVCLDVSKSMLAEDTTPNRLERAKADVVDLLQYLRGDQVGLIAFAGRASVVCPMTTDFGFVKLLLSHLGPESVGRGGTQLEAPLRTAMEGFSPAGDVSRIILLITDGEDHDSFPLAAAQEAAARGIRVITMGFGSEAGATIEYTDPRTGQRTPVRDANDQIVTSRLDGQTLRDIALKTDGAYIPVGTGSLDLQGIYEQHIKPLLRGNLQQGQVRLYRELYPWFVLLGLVMLLIAAALQAVASREGQRKLFTAFVGAFCLALAPGRVTAQTGSAVPIGSAVQTGSAANQATSVPPAGAPTASNAPATPSSSNTPAVTPPTESPRETYNRGHALLDRDPSQAETLLRDAVSRAANDGTLRFYGNFNLGWLMAQRADLLLADKPSEALEWLEKGTQFLHQAIRVRPEDTAARQNLEILLRRIVQVKDLLEKQKERSFDEQLRAVVEQQREILTQQAALSELSPPDRHDDVEEEPIVRQYRQLATRQRLIRADLELLAERLTESLRHLEQEAQQPAANPQGTPNATGAPHHPTEQAQTQAIQLRLVEPFLQEAIQRMGQSRRDLRLRFGTRAFRRASHALDALKQAQDQLKEPRERLHLLISDTNSLRGLVSQKHTLPQNQASPNWLSNELLLETQSTIIARTKDLHAVVATLGKPASVAATSSGGTVNPPSSQAAGNDPLAAVAPAEVTPESQAADKWRDVAPWLLQAISHFETVPAALEQQNYPAALSAQQDALDALAEAAERLLDVRGLIETAYAHESVIQQQLERVPLSPEAHVAQILQQSQQQQTRNRQRTQRLHDALRREQQGLEQQVPQGPGVAPTDTASTANPTAQALQRVNLATELAQKALNWMHESETQLAQPVAEDAARTPSAEPKTDGISESAQQAANGWGVKAIRNVAQVVQSWVDRLKVAWQLPLRPLPAAHAATTNAVNVLSELRRLYFSIVEHVRDAAHRQAALRDESLPLRGVTDPQKRAEQLGGLRFRQQELTSFTQELAKALQSMETGEKGEDSQDGNNSPPAEDGAKYAAAGEHVLAASQAMAKADAAMEPSTTEMSAMTEHQDKALQELIEALKILDPESLQKPPQDSPPDASQENQPTSDSSDPSSGADPTTPPEPTPGDEEATQSAQNLGLQEVLQRVRDRDAKRQQGRMRNAGGRQPVDKDW